MKMAARVREYVSGMVRKTFTAQLVRMSLGLDNGKAVRVVLTDMLGRGEVARVSIGVYRYLGFDRRSPNGHTVFLPRIYRAMHVRGTFTSKEIARLTDATVDFVGKTARRLVVAGDVEELCREQTSRFGREIVYRVRNSDRFYLERVRSSLRKSCTENEKFCEGSE
jgi:hypothetical protein